MEETSAAPYAAYGYCVPGVWLSSQPSATAESFERAAPRDLVADGEIADGLRFKAFRSGFFLADVSAWKQTKPSQEGELRPEQEVANKMQLVRLFNTHLLCIHDAVFHKSPKKWLAKKVLSHDDIVAVHSFDTPFRAMAYSSSSGVLSDQSCPFASRQIVTDESIQMSFQSLARFLKHPSDYALTLAELLLHSYKAVEEHNYDLALIAAWTITEKLLSAKWNAYVDSQSKPEAQVEGTKVPVMTAKRAKRLREGRDYTASVITEFLTCLGQLPFEFYEPLCVARKARNDWIHELKPVSYQEALTAVRLAQNMMELVENVSVSVHLELRLYRLSIRL